jgi:hypothetical protein
MRDGSDPPSGFSVYACRRSHLSEEPWSADRELLLLPSSIHVDRRELRFFSRSIGIRGLDATIVWHPGWPIRHPLVESGRAAVLWPTPHQANLAQLPEVHPGEFGFAPDGGSMGCTTREFELLTQVPLEIDRPPMAIWQDVLINGLGTPPTTKS